MMRLCTLLLAGCALLGAVGNAWCQSQEPPASGTAAQPVPSSSATATPAPEKADAKPAPASQPGVPPLELKKLEFLKGTWNSKLTDASGTTATGKAHYAPAFSGMVIEGDHSYTMDGKPMKGRTTWGWDAEKGQYQLVWVSSMGSDAKMYYGTFPNESSLSFFTTYMQGGKAVTEKLTFTFPDPNTYVFTIENDVTGSMAKVMEETATRGAANAKSPSKPAASKSAKPAGSTSKKKAG